MQASKKRHPRIVCFYVSLHSKTEQSVRAHAPSAEFIDTSSDDYAYTRAFIGYWDGTDDLIVIEQDNEITAEVIPSFTACEQDWCSYSYQGPSAFGYLYHALGCTKFSAALQRELPMEDYFVLKRSAAVLPAGKRLPPPWWQLDDYMRRILLNTGHQPHVHGHLPHHHDYTKDGRYQSARMANELQPDNTVLAYENNPDLTRGKFIGPSRERGLGPI